ncbi:metallophosphoesterase family protein [Archaeoglobus veneficus]|uniref:Phosphoesterase n=1 Tax=Archaeoglobus veneficus (strain DSM 11195 / SNP6) TaxID=693661 RepID=F2KN59_ARCVS|nr:metallophosphoesterase family protein [Archaeoglobus veneficus]AEA46160.1 phosphodiesterase, MJ0936 family [Archaeoglobus veneficus SNP6]
MRIGIISDVHANLVALEEVLEKLTGCDVIYSAGDVVGYYPFPNEVVEVFRREGIESVAGNHDVAIASGDFAGMNQIAMEAGIYTRQVLTGENLEWLRELPLNIETSELSIYHGMPAEGEAAYIVYIFPEDPITDEFLKDADKHIVVGHTHIQFVKEHGGKLFFNPGSVGQPRDGDARAAYAIYDTESGELRLERVEYNIEEVCEAVEKAGLSRYLCSRLYDGY